MGPKSAKSAKYRVFCGYTWKPPGIPGKYPATAWVSCRFPQFCVRFCPRPALRLRETREFPEWSTKHPLFSLEISGNAKCWGPSVFLFVCRKSIYRPSCAPPAARVALYAAAWLHTIIAAAAARLLAKRLPRCTASRRRTCCAPEAKHGSTRQLNAVKSALAPSD